MYVLFLLLLLQMVCATACEVGCAIAECPNLSMDDSPIVPEVPPNYMDSDSIPTYLVVCRYAPGFDSEEPVYKHRPYWKGWPCTKCPKGFNLCDEVPSTRPMTGYAPLIDSVAGAEEMPPTIRGLCC